MSHVLACALCSHSTVNWTPGNVLLAFTTAAVIIGLLCWAGVREQKRMRAGKPPREPSNVSPAMASLLSGRNVAAYTAPVRAVAPGGITVTQRRCCARGHQSPRQAVDHAAQIAQRIAATGR